jgi:hypothetical protein
LCRQTIETLAGDRVGLQGDRLRRNQAPLAAPANNASPKRDEELENRSLSDRKAKLARLLARKPTGIVFNEARWFTLNWCMFVWQT